MNQTRVFLLFAWIAAATLLFMQWNKEQTAALQQQQAAVPTQAAASNGAVPGAVPTAPSGTVAGVPAAPAQAGVPQVSNATAQNSAAVTVTTDTLRVVLDGGNVRHAELLKFPNEAKSTDGVNVTLFDADPARFYEAQSGWVSSTGAAPSHLAQFVPEGNARNVTLADKQDAIAVPFTWTGDNGVTIRRTYTFPRGGYAIAVRDEVVNHGNANWQGYVYRQLVRNPPPQKTGYTNPEAFAFHGATWYTPGDKYERRKYDDFVDDGTLDKDATGGWIALLQHYFFSAWIPGDQDKSKFTLSTTQDNGVTHYVVRALGPGVNVAPGQKAETNARLWVGPKLVSAIEAQNVPGLTRAVDFSRFSIMATLAGWLFFVLSAIHSVVGNWGWSIIGLVILVRALLFPIAAKQFDSMAKMRKLQPRMQQLKERYGDDRQKLQMATMELYKKEKVNPATGCLPLLIQMPIFLALYWMLSESVELRHAPWALWIDNLSARDPYFVLPVINVAIMWATQRLAPTAGMDPTQQKMMQLMPIVIGVTMIFFPAGLVLYWVTNGALGLLQQWWMLRRDAARSVPAKA
ncbi:Inner membrane protein translocase component YidC [Lysobacter dokdonensis DS-58]|uniref:Membrane protein insertase YidC n=1 Tax=Lysobacter dokdonensis DS-58 TaxID=1300345 RepID=A0A0A2WKF6_9GAMM|nr:membrane protein insertase YidC [Lysobacter dokdonensis]KGQ19182.1 Inner membrane protein translocase component YidC [Lysobacter dokdonensis DS-58]